MLSDWHRRTENELQFGCNNVHGIARRHVEVRRAPTSPRLNSSFASILSRSLLIVVRFSRSELLYLCKWRVLHLNLIAEQTTRFNYMLFNFLQEGEWISRRLVPSLLLNKLASALMHVNCEVFLVWEWWGSDGLYLIARVGYELNLRPNLAIIFYEFRHCSHVIWVKLKYASEMLQFAAYHI